MAHKPEDLRDAIAKVDPGRDQRQVHTGYVGGFGKAMMGQANGSA